MQSYCMEAMCSKDVIKKTSHEHKATSNTLWNNAYQSLPGSIVLLALPIDSVPFMVIRLSCTLTIIAKV